MTETNTNRVEREDELEAYLAYARQVLMQVRATLPAADPEVVAVVLDKVLPPLYYWREEQRRAAGAVKSEGAGADEEATGAGEGAPAQSDLEAVLSGLKWHPMSKGSGEWAFATDREGSPRPELARLVEELKNVRRIQVGRYNYELSGKFLHRFPVKS
ncbi:hypothetical protein [Conexivisphaera calida]|uniref:Uncharacterized protein n=1 Tax=Conexivisphaera calida TaxID=1874277 RepID=A0A4P2VE83_9ARCH|nr:hypothetical protein [Conexivisphaera calida]BBE42421.1 hypothetical protein NAS2_1032 [Conexivisphaera calida]